MTSLYINKPNTFNLESIVPTKISNDGKIRLKYISNDEQTPILIETNYMDLVDINNQELLLRVPESHDFFQKLDLHISNVLKSTIQYLQGNSLEKMRYRMITENLDSQDILRIIISNSKSFKTIIFDTNKTPIKLSKIDKNDQLKAKVIFEIPCIQQNANIFGLELKVHQIKLKSLNDIETSNNNQSYGSSTSSLEDELSLNSEEIVFSD